MSTIRPNLYPQTQAHPQAQDSAKLAAQRAFFNAALGQAQAPAAPQAPVATQAAVAAQATHRVATAPQEPGQQRILRPGSLIDIRI